MPGLRLGLGLGLSGNPRLVFPASTAGLKLWLRSDLGVALSGSAVTAWADQSGNGNDATQATGAARPTFASSDANWGGLPSITFDGTDDFLGGALALGSTTSHAAYIVMRDLAALEADAGGWTVTAGGADYNAAGAYTLREISGPLLSVYRNGGERSGATHPGPNVNYGASVRFDGTNQTTKVNGVTGTSVASNDSFSTTTSYFLGRRQTGGGSDFLN